jgi:hypothetical protein
LFPVPPWANATIARPTIVSRKRFPIISVAPTAQLSAAADEAKIASITVAIAATIPEVRWMPPIVGIDQFIGGELSGTRTFRVGVFPPAGV